MDLHKKEKNIINEDASKNVNKSMWEKFLQFKAENPNSRKNNKIIDPKKRS